MSDWHDVENNLAFPPRENITSNNLTDDWKAEKIKRNKYYFFRDGPYSIVQIGFINYDNDLLELSRDEWIEPEVHTDLEILAPCDYDHFVELTEKVEELKKDIQTLTNNYKLLEKKQASDIAHGQALVDDFGDFEALYEELQRLRKIAVKYDRIKAKGNYPDKISQLKSRIKHLLELQANQDKEVERLRDENNDFKQKNSDLLALISEGNTVINNLRQLFEEQEEELKTLKMLDMNLSPLITGGEIEIDELRQLLKQCQKVLSYYANSKLPCDCSSNIHYDNQTALNLLTRINEALK